MRINPIARVNPITGNRLPPVFYSSGLHTVQSLMPTMSLRRNPNAMGGGYSPVAIAHITPDIQVLRGNIDMIRSFSLPQPLTLAERWENEREARLVSAAAESEQTQDDEAFERCTTCAERSYVDRSADGTASMQMPTRLSPDEAPAAVIAHEREHLASARVRAEREGHRVLSQHIVIHMDICAECNLAYVSGGEARTIIAPQSNIYTALHAYYSMQNMFDWNWMY